MSSVSGKEGSEAVAEASPPAGGRFASGAGLVQPAPAEACRRPAGRFVPGADLLRPAPLLAAVVIAVNMLWLKQAHPGWWSGKLSDFAICFFLPVVLVALYEWAAFAAGRHRPPPAAVPILACGVTAAYFSALQLVPAAAALHVDLLGLLPGGRRFVVTPDPWDLLALPMAGVALVWLWREGART